MSPDPIQPLGGLCSACLQPESNHTPDCALRPVRVITDKYALQLVSLVADYYVIAITRLGIPDLSLGTITGERFSGTEETRVELVRQLMTKYIPEDEAGKLADRLMREVKHR